MTKCDGGKDEKDEGGGVNAVAGVVRMKIALRFHLVSDGTTDKAGIVTRLWNGMVLLGRGRLGYTGRSDKCEVVEQSSGKWLTRYFEIVHHLLTTLTLPHAFTIYFRLKTHLFSHILSTIIC